MIDPTLATEERAGGRGAPGGAINGWVWRARSSKGLTKLTLGLAGVAGLAMLIGFFAAPQTACNDGSTGCCVMCMGSCPCGDVCAPCGEICTKVHGCACSVSAAALQSPDGGSDSR